MPNLNRPWLIMGDFNSIFPHLSTRVVLILIVYKANYFLDFIASNLFFNRGYVGIFLLIILLFCLPFLIVFLKKKNWVFHFNNYCLEYPICHHIINSDWKSNTNSSPLNAFILSIVLRSNSLPGDPQV